LGLKPLSEVLLSTLACSRIAIICSVSTVDYCADGAWEFCDWVDGVGVSRIAFDVFEVALPGLALALAKGVAGRAFRGIALILREIWYYYESWELGWIFILF